MQWLLELVLIGLLAATLFHALRLERALGVLKRDRSALEGLVAGFNASTRQAEAAVEQLHVAAEGAGRTISRQAEMALALKDDLVFLMERGDGLADRLDVLVRSAKSLTAAEPRYQQAAAEPRYQQAAAEPRYQQAVAEPGYQQAAAEPRYQHATAEPQYQYVGAEPARSAERREPPAAAEPRNERSGAEVRRADADVADTPRMRSQAERDLLRALRMAR
jgi:hypothetical protein